MADNFSYSLVGGQPVKVTSLEVSASGTTYAPPGQAYNPVVCDISGSLEEKSETITKNGMTEILPSDGKAGMSKVTATVSVSPYMLQIYAPYKAENGTYSFIGEDENGNIIGMTCGVFDENIEMAVGDGSVEIDTSGAEATIVWTPSVTITQEPHVWYAANAIS